MVDARRDEVIFTSGATESNNLVILGLAKAGIEQGRKHIITAAIEHKAVLEPCARLAEQGFDMTILPVMPGGVVELNALRGALRPETLLVSIMPVNNETGVRQPLQAIAQILKDHPAYFQTDAAQGSGKELESLRNSRIDLISLSGHKFHAPKGVGALITRRRGYERPPLTPLQFGGRQERGLRSGTLPVALVAALGTAAEIAVRDQAKRVARCREIREQSLAALEGLNPRLSGDQALVMVHVLNLAIPGLDSEALMLALKDLIAISNGSACTSSSYTPSYVLKAMGMTDDEANEAVRISWCHLTPDVDWASMAQRISSVR